LDRFDGMETQVLGLSVDSEPCLKAWADSLGGVSYPLLSDFYPHGQVARLFGVFRPEGYSERAIYVLDKQGCVVYVDVHDIDKQPDNEVLFDLLAQIQGLPVPARPNTPPPAPPQGDVVLYCTPWCPSCPRARAYLKERGIPYVEVDISRDREAARRVRSWANGNETTPTFDIKGTVIVDFDRTKLEQALAILKN
jgi:glutaredoxin